MKRASLKESVKERFIKNGGPENPKPKEKKLPGAETGMLNTRVPRSLIKRIKLYCAGSEITMQDFINTAVIEKLDGDK